MFELLSEREPINRIVKPFIALAPVATIGYTKSPIKYIGYDSWLVNSFLRHPGQYLNEGHLNELLAELFCRGPDKYLCENLIFLLVGYDSVQMNLTRLPVYISHLPAGTSKWNLVHYAQSVRSGQLQKLDLGTEINQRCYYQSTAPKFFLDQITNQHIHLFHSDNDWLADSRDFEYLIQNLKGGHIDYFELQLFQLIDFNVNYFYS